MNKLKIIIAGAFLVLIGLIVMLSIEKISTGNQLSITQNQLSQVTTGSVAEAAALARHVEVARQQMTIDSLEIAENNKAIKTLEDQNAVLRSGYNGRYQSVKDNNETITNLLGL